MNNLKNTIIVLKDKEIIKNVGKKIAESLSPCNYYIEDNNISYFDGTDLIVKIPVFDTINDNTIDDKIVIGEIPFSLIKKVKKYFIVKIKNNDVIFVEYKKKI